jgi:AraC-like DNA-binding protein
MPEFASFLPDPAACQYAAAHESAAKGRSIMLEPLTDAILLYTARQPGESPYVTAIDGVYVLRSDHPKPPAHRVSQPALCIVAQGAKWASFGEQRLEYRAGQALVVGVETPSLGRVFEASPERPCLVLIIELDLAMMQAVAQELATVPQASGETQRGVFVADFDGPLADCALRIVRLLDTPEAIAMLFPLVMREICYWLLAGPHGGEIARMAAADSPSQRVMNAVHVLRERFAQPVRIEELAAVAQLSTSAFHRQFKALTALTPLQYQKQLRLLEARRLLLSRSASVEQAAFEVGYESASQFSREYVRMFGTPPRRDSKRLKAMLDAA